jgi:hypothetical protein
LIFSKGSGGAARILALLLGCAAAAYSLCGVGAQATCRVLDPELAGYYQGGCKDGLAEGYGVAKGTAEYQGYFHAGRKQGKGVKTWPSGDRYEGDFVDDRKQGIGTYTWSPNGPFAGQSYTGAWRNDRRNGYGVYRWPSGDHYAGQWVDDKIAGMPTPAMIARARAKTETLVAVTQPGVKVCRALQVGIAVRDWIRGVVTAVDADRIEVRIDDPGKQPHVIDARPLVKGMSFWSDAAKWTPCVY